jgi:L-fuconolactonase
MNPTRRQLLQGLAGSAMASALLSVAPPGTRAQAAPDALIVDTHQHMWDLSKFKLPWLDNAPEVYRHSYRPQEYAEATKGLNVRSVYMEVDLGPSARPAEAEYVSDLCRSKSGAMRAAVIGGNPAADGFEDYVKHAQAGGFVRGVRQVLHSDSTPPGTCLADGFVGGIRLLES